MFNQHNVQILLGHEWYKEVTEGLEGQRKNLFLPSNEELAGAILKDDTSSSSSTYNNEGWFRPRSVRLRLEVLRFGFVPSRRFEPFLPKHRWCSFL